MTRLDPKIRAFGAMIRRMSVVGATDEQLLKRQKLNPPPTPLMKRVFGARLKGVDVVDTEVRDHAHDLALRVYRPSKTTGKLPLVLLYHGGGWVTGGVDGWEWIASSIALGGDVVVVSVGYGLAPTHRWPVAAEDSYAALLDAVERADEFKADATRLAVIGDSAGGNLAAVMTLMSRDRSGPAIAWQGLIYPSTDLSAETVSMVENADAPVLNQAEALRYRELYVPDEADWTHPYASPARAESHVGLPPALVQVAEHDPLRDDGLAYAGILRRAGVEVRETAYVGMPHGYLSFPGLCRSADQAMAEICQELRRHLG